jgi:apolipoprotein N-acyltransferase
MTIFGHARLSAEGPPGVRNPAQGMVALPPVLAWFIALLCGGLNVFSFAPFGWWPVQILTLAAVFSLAAVQKTAKHAAWIGSAYGFSWLTCGVYWLYISMHDYGGMPAWMAGAAVLLLGFALSAFPALALGLSNHLARRFRLNAVAALLMVFPSLWMLCEWARGWMFTGFPWIISGYAHTKGPLAGLAPIIGVHGIGWAAAVVAACLALLPRRYPLLLGAAIMVSGLMAGGMEWTKPHGRPISVRLLQGNVPQDLKFDSEHIAGSLVWYRNAIEAAPADLIATPETALPLFQYELPETYLPRLVDYSRRTGSHLAIGIPYSSKRGHYANSMIGFSPTDRRAYRYDKHHLVPFGEFIPFGFRWFVDMMRMPLGDFSQAPLLQAPFQVKDQFVQPNICYEDLFGEEIAAQLRNSERPATMLLNMSNIAWFGDSIALPQHLQISQMRSLETGRPMLRATNTGITAVIDPKGRVVASLPPFTEGVLTMQVQGHEGRTPFLRFGNSSAVMLAVLTLAGAIIFALRRSR